MISRTLNELNDIVAVRNPTEIQSSAVQRTLNILSEAINDNNSSEEQEQPLASALSHAFNGLNEIINNNNSAERRTRPFTKSDHFITLITHVNDLNVAFEEGFSLKQLAARAAAARKNDEEESLIEKKLFNARRQEIDRVNDLNINEDNDLFKQYCVQTQKKLQDAQGAIFFLIHSDK